MVLALPVEVHEGTFGRMVLVYRKTRPINVLFNLAYPMTSIIAQDDHT